MHHRCVVRRGKRLGDARAQDVAYEPLRGRAFEELVCRHWHPPAALKVEREERCSHGAPMQVVLRVSKYLHLVFYAALAMNR